MIDQNDGILEFEVKKNINENIEGLKTITDEVSSLVAISQCGKYAAVAESNNFVNLYNIKKEYFNEPVQIFIGNEDTINSIIISDDLK